MTEYWETPIDSFLRRPPRNLARSAYAVEVNPWVRRGDVEAALLFRGTIVSAFGYIDTRLSEVAIRSSLMPEYEGLRGNLSFKFSSRMKYLREIIEFGPFFDFRNVAEAYLSRLEAHYEIRNIAAHAHMQVLPDWGVTFTDYSPNKDRKITKRQRRLTLHELERSAWRLARLSRLCQTFIDELEQRTSIPALVDV